MIYIDNSCYDICHGYYCNGYKSDDCYSISYIGGNHILFGKGIVFDGYDSIIIPYDYDVYIFKDLNDWIHLCIDYNRLSVHVVDKYMIDIRRA